MFWLRKLQTITPLILLTVIIITSCEKEVNRSQLVERNNLLLDRGKAFTGKSIQYFDGTSNIQSSTSYRMGKRHGEYKLFYENGQLELKEVNEDGLTEGVSIRYDQNGNKLVELNYSKGKRNGICKIFYEDGQVQEEGEFVNNDLTCLSKRWHENGNQQGEGRLVAGVRDGNWKFWDISGQRSKDQLFDKGRLLETKLFISISDVDGNEYPYISIGDQVWMGENLKVTHYRDGTKIPNLIQSGDWVSTSSGAYCYYDNSDSLGENYGALYNWYAVNGDIDGDGTKDKELAPEGWHVPSDAEWQELVDYLGGDWEAGGKLKEIGINHWKNPNIGGDADEKDFTALPGGRRDIFDDFSNEGNEALFWSDTESRNGTAWCRTLFSSTNHVSHQRHGKTAGISVRLLRD